MELTTSLIPENIRRPETITDLDHRRARRAPRAPEPAVRARPHVATALGSHNEAYQRVRGLMASETLFDVTREPQKVRDAYGPSQFGEQALVARRLVEAGVPFVRVGRAWWDSHGQNFETHQELVPELDHVMATLLDDLDRARAAREHAGRHARRVRPHADDQRQPGPRPLRLRLERAPSRAAASRGARSTARPTPRAKRSSTARSAPPSSSPPSTSALGIDHQKNYYVGSRPGPADRARHRANRRRARLNAFCKASETHRR